MKKENLYTQNCIRTNSGIYFDVLNPTPEMIDINDIAHALSNIARFNGHLPHFYSVAQHSVLVAGICKDPKNLLCALMHDASEAYLCDIPKPIKPLLTNYIELEEKIMQVIAKKFGFEWPMPAEIKEADKFMLEVEWEHLMLAKSDQLKTHNPKTAKQMFLDKFNEYSKQQCRA